VKIGFSIDFTDRGIGRNDWTGLQQPLILEVPLGSAEAWLGKLLAERKVMPSAAKRIEYTPEDVSHRKPPTSVSAASSRDWLKQVASDIPIQERLLNAREVAARLGVSERWVRDHTTRRSPRIQGVKLGTLMRYRRADVEEFMERLTTSRSSLQARFGG
jgi:excisionase family DNA binding protein